ncbi:hypothetical protein TNCV_3449201 [Trichonephila clavipes]|nr:hypothetical protein TNCV_3449201 [Trichonephila clavipes]
MEAGRNLCDVFREETVTARTCQSGFAKFCLGDFSLKIYSDQEGTPILRYSDQMPVTNYYADLIRVVEDLDGTVESTDTIAKLKTKIEKSSTFESDPDFFKTLIKNSIDERVSRNERELNLEKQKIELAKLQLAQLEKEVELQTAKNEALSLNPAAKVEEKQFETNIENMIKSIW